MKQEYNSRIKDRLRFKNKLPPEVKSFIHTYLTPEKKCEDAFIHYVLIENISADGVSITIEKKSSERESSSLTIYVYGQNQQKGRVDVIFKFGQNNSYELQTLNLSFSPTHVNSKFNVPAIQSYTIKPNQSTNLTLEELRDYMHLDVYFAIQETYEAVKMLINFITLSDIQRNQLLKKVGNRVICKKNVPHSSRNVEFALNLIKIYIDNEESDPDDELLRLHPSLRQFVQEFTTQLLRNNGKLIKKAQLNAGRTLLK